MSGEKKTEKRGKRGGQPGRRLKIKWSDKKTPEFPQDCLGDCGRWLERGTFLCSDCGRMIDNYRIPRSEMPYKVLLGGRKTDE